MVKNSMVTCVVSAVGFLTVLAVVATSARADLYTVQADIKFTGTTPLGGAAPWLTAAFDDQGTPGSVIMTLTATNLTGNEFISDWYLNIVPALDPTDLVFSAPTKVGTFNTPAISLGTDLFKANGDGKYDILLDLGTAGGLSSRFSAGDSITYTITGIPSLTARSFATLSTPAGGHGPFVMAAHVQGVGNQSDSSVWVAPAEFNTPEPATIAFLTLGAWPMLRRKR